MKYFFYSFIAFTLFSCKTTKYNPNDTIEVMRDFSEIERKINSEPEKLWVINFWATTCPPCLREMPHFKELERQDHGHLIHVLLISLDQAKDLENRVIPYVKKHDIQPEVVLLSDDNYSAWTDKIDPSWYGALPATFILKGGKRKFKFGAYDTFKQLEDDVKSISN